MRKANRDIRAKAIEADVPLYKIAEQQKIHYVTFNSRLRKELSKEKKQEIFNIIDQLKGDEN